MGTISQVLQRARRYEALTPGERALLKLAEGLVCSVVVAALPVVAQALGQGGVQWSDVLHTALAAASVAALLAISKYAKAQGDPAPMTPMSGASLSPATAVTIAPSSGAKASALTADGLSDPAGDGVDMMDMAAMPQ